MKIQAWVSLEGLSQERLGRIIERNKARAHRIINGAIPTPEEMKIIFESSCRRVTPNDYYDFMDGYDSSDAIPDTGLSPGVNTV